jgi:hypothetical protein
MDAVRRRLAAAALGATCMCAAAPLAAQDPSAPPPARTPIPFRQDRESGGDLAARAAGVLALGVLAAYGGAVALKRSGFLAGRALPGKARRVRLAETVRLSRRSVLHVVEYRGEELLLAESEHGVQLVSRRQEGAGDA